MQRLDRMRSVCLVVLLLNLYAIVSSYSSANDEVTDVLNGTITDDTTVTSCATGCTCKPPITRTQLNKLIIDCANSTNSSFVVEEIDRLLIDRELELSDLTIVNSPLEFIPSSICRLTRLNRLMLHANRLTSLPVGCFNNLKNLIDFGVGSNRITELQVMINVNK